MMIAMPTGLDLVRNWLDREGKHKEAGTCPGCGQSVTSIGITKLAYVFDECSCGATEYTHLIEQLWHRTCLSKSEG